MRRTSTTASLAAGIRAHHWQWNPAPIFADEYAVDMLSLGWRLIVKNRLLNWLVVNKLLAPFHPIHTENILRVRYAEDCLNEAIKAGLVQYVILGAGFDTFSLRGRELADQVQVFEVDHPATQRIKRERVRRVAGHIPPNLAFVPVDFETERLDEVLRGSRFDAGQPAFFSWLGTTYYLTQDAIRETLGCIAAVAAPGSRLVCDYKLPLAPEQSVALNDKLERLVKRLGEPMRSAFAPEELKAEMARIGWAELESLLPPAQARHYLQNRSDIIAPPPNFAFALFGC